MVVTRDLFEFLARAAQGDESECPPHIDVDWHACLEHPQEYQAFCLNSFGVILEHVVNTPAPCRAKIQGPCHARIRR
jgi:hypothetical protein